MVQTYTVSNAVELAAAIDGASDGDRIELEAGEYGELLLNSVSFSGEGITIASADPSDMAIFDKVGLYRSDNIHFDQIEVDFEPVGNTGYNAAFYAFESDDISIKNSTLEGGYRDTASDPEVAERPSGVGIRLRDNENITIENNDISVFHVGINFGYVDGLVVNNNEVYDLRTSPLTGGGTNNAEVIGNHFSSSNPLNLGGSGDHGDLIHFYPLAGMDGPMENIVIKDNFLEQGEGTQSLLGIYIDDAGGGVSGIGYTNVVIENNVVHNGDGQGIRVENADGLSIMDNTLIQSSGHAGDAPGIVLTSGTQNAVIDNNIIAGAISGSSITTSNATALNVEIGDNFFVQYSNPFGENYVGDMFVNGLTPNGEVRDFTPLEGSDAEGYGSTLTGFDVGRGAHVAVISDTRGEGLDMRSVHFDAEALYGSEGEIDITNADVDWDFGDGNTGSGDAITHIYDIAGSYDVTGTFTLENGETISVDKTIDVFSPDAVIMDFEDGFVDISDIENRVTTVGDVTTEEGRFGEALRLNTTSARVEVIRSEEILENPEFTMSFAFQKDGGTEANSDDGAFIYFTGTSYIGTSEGALAFSGQTSTGYNIRMNVDAEQIEDGEWHHLTYTFSSEDRSAVLYLDGEEVDRVNNVSGIQHTTTGHDLHLGGRTGGAFGGLMDEVEFTRAALTPDEVRDRYESLFEEETEAEADAEVVAPAAPEAEPEVVDVEPADNEQKPFVLPEQEDEVFDEAASEDDLEQDVCNVLAISGEKTISQRDEYSAPADEEGTGGPVADEPEEQVETAPEVVPEQDPVIEMQTESSLQQAPLIKVMRDSELEEEEAPETVQKIALKQEAVAEAAEEAGPQQEAVAEVEPVTDADALVTEDDQTPDEDSAEEVEAEEPTSTFADMFNALVEALADLFGLSRGADGKFEATDQQDEPSYEAAALEEAPSLFDIITSTGDLDEQVPAFESSEEIDPYQEADDFLF